MSNIISSYPTYDGDPLHIFTLDNYSFFYEQDGEIFPLEKEINKNGLSSEIVLDDENGLWNPDEYSLCISREISVSDAFHLYGATSSSEYNYQVACRRAAIGLGLAWNSPQSGQKGATFIGEIKNTTKKQVFSLNAEFPKGTLRGELNLSLILFIMYPGNPTGDEVIYANEVGSKVGVVDIYSARVDGNGSFFPIQEVNSPGEALWAVKCNLVDPCTDVFSDSVAILINSAHKNFKMLDRTDSRNFSPQLFIEVISSAIGIIIESMRELDENLKDIQNAQEGSVALAIKYFQEKLGWNIDTPSTTSKSIRNFLEQKLLDL